MEWARRFWCQHNGKAALSPNPIFIAINTFDAKMCKKLKKINTNVLSVDELLTITSDILFSRSFFCSPLYNSNMFSEENDTPHDASLDIVEQDASVDIVEHVQNVGRDVAQDSDSILTDPRNARFTMFPVKYTDLWEMYKQSVASFWTVEEVDLTADVKDWEHSLNDNERFFIETILAFFAASDGIVMENLAAHFMNDVKISEARAFYGFQIAIENIHSEMYSLLIETYVKSPERKKTLLESIEEVECVKNKAQWAMRWIGSNESFAERIIAFACVEGIFFSASFCAIFWLKKRGLMPGLTFSNELISRDEGLHRDFACALYNHLDHKLDPQVVFDIVKEAVMIEKQFVRDSLPVGVIGMNAKMMEEYVEFVADHLLGQIGLDSEYRFGTENPFNWMEQISLQGKTIFFEKRVGEYQKAGVIGQMNNFSLDADF